MTCHVWGCDETPVLKVEYRDTMAQTNTETRCGDCAKELLENESNTILDKEVLDEAWHRWQQTGPNPECRFPPAV